MTTTIKVETRNTLTKAERSAMRKQGSIPGIVYGSKLTSTTIAVNEKALLAMVKSNRNGVIHMEIARVGSHPVMINEVQKDPITGNIIHVDFHQINMNESIKSLVFIELTGEARGVKEGGVQQVLLHQVEVRCLPNDLPASFTVDISELEVGMNLLVSELKISSNIELLTDPTEVIVTILSPQKEEAVDTDETIVAEPNASAQAAAEETK